MAPLNFSRFFVVMVYVLQLILITASHRLGDQFRRRNNNELYACLSSRLPTSVRTVYPCNTLSNHNSSQYRCHQFDVTNLSSMHGARIRHSPAAVVYVRNSHDVQQVLKCATKLNYVVNALSGGHNYEGYGLGSVPNNIVVNLAGINHMNINPHDQTGTFGPGARVGPIYYKAYQYDQLTINAGSCAWVGLGGQALGGGFGFLARLHGLLADNILEMQAVNAYGELLTINATHEPDLFWALRGGGGGSFVIVTEFKIRLIKSPPLVTRYSSTWSGNASKAVLQGHQRLLFNSTMFSSNRNLFWLMFVNRDHVTITLYNYGFELERFNRTIALFSAALPTPDQTTLHRKDWLTHVYEESGVSNMSGNHRQLLLENLTFPVYYFKAKHLYYDKPISDQSLDRLIHRLSVVGSEPNFMLSPWDGYMNTVPVGRTAFPHRRYKFGIQFMVSWKTEQEERRQMHRLKQVYMSIYNDSTKHSYINYIDRDVPNWMEVYYHTHQQRLKKIQHTYDRDNRFSFEKSIE